MLMRHLHVCLTMGMVHDNIILILAITTTEKFVGSPKLPITLKVGRSI